MRESSATPDINTALLARRSNRKFTAEPVAPEIVDILEQAAQRAPSSQYLNDWSAIRVEDSDLKHRVAEIGRQHYIAEAPLLYVFVIDERRNAMIARRRGIGIEDGSFTLTTSYRFTQAQNDATLALHAMDTAANAFGLGTVVLGSILNDVAGLIEALRLPRYTYPVLGLAIGHADQRPALKPRLPREAQFFTDHYPQDDETLLDGYIDDFDDAVHHYYDLRNADRPVDAFSQQIATAAVSTDVLGKGVSQPAKDQGFSLDR